VNIDKIHNSAMAKVDLANISKLRGDDEKAICYFNEALDLEKKAANEAIKKKIGEPSISILLKSAAYIALHGNQYLEAEKLVCTALSINISEETAEELRNLYEEINFDRHLRLKGVKLSNSEMQVSIAGNGVGYGISKFEDVSNRIDNTEKLLIRTAERKAGKKFRTGGRVPNDLMETWQSYMGIPKAASFAFTVRFGGVQGKLYDDTSETIDDVINNISLINNGDYEQLKNNIKDKDYLENFISLTKELAPDGDNVSLVGFTIMRNNNAIDTKLSKHRNKISLIDNVDSVPGKKKGKESNEDISTINGVLTGARTNQKSIWLKEDGRIRERKIIVPAGMTEIVTNYWDKVVIIKGYDRPKGFELKEIDPGK
jgi:hypothetical protein